MNTEILFNTSKVNGVISSNFVGNAVVREICVNCKKGLRIQVMINGSCPECGLVYNWEEIEIEMLGVGTLRKYTPVFEVR